MIIDVLKKENMLALKAHDDSKRAVLSIVINKYMIAGYEAKSKGKELTDTDCVGIIQKTIKELEEEKSSYELANRVDEVKNIEYQMSCISNYLPKMMSEDEVKKIILFLEDKSVPSVMKHFKTNYAGKVDMGLVNKVLKSL